MERLLGEGVELHKAGRLAEAEARYRQILDREPNHGDANHLLGLIALGAGDLRRAEALISKALAANPFEPAYHANLGSVYQAMGRPAEAERRLGRATDLRPDFTDAHFNLGNALRDLGRDDEAISAYLRAVELDPGHVPALGNLAALFEGRNHLEQAREAAEKGLAHTPGDPILNLTMAKLERREGGTDPSRLRRLLDSSPAPVMEMGARFELGHLHDRAGDAGAAFSQFLKANDLQRKYLPEGVDKARYGREIDALNAAFTEDWTRSWTPPLEGGGVPVFLVGFPRSGTTLLERILRAHSGIDTLEEPATVSALRDELLPLGPYPGVLASLAPEAIGRLRRVYSKAAEDASGGRHGGVTVDKMPLNVAEAGLIHRVFPDAAFIFALRHPLDVCLSCFMQAFELNDPMANFLDLGDTGVLYAEVMGLWRRYVSLLGLRVHSVRYEDLVDDVEGEARAVVEFLGLDWDPGVLDFAARARTGARIKTPSYHQVVEPVYRRARYRWRRYERHLAPIRGLLEPFIEAFGYG